MADFSLTPNTLARCSGSGPWTRASSSWRSILRRSSVASWPRSAFLAQKVLTGARFRGGLLVDDQVRVGRVRPALPPVGKPLQERAPREIVQRPDAGGDDELTVAELI